MTTLLLVPSRVKVDLGTDLVGHWPRHKKEMVCMALDLDAFNELAEVDTAPDSTIIDRLRFDDALEIPHQLTDVDLWLNYTNDDLYHLDKEVRRVIDTSRYTRETKGGMRTAVPLVFMKIFGRRPSGGGDGRACRIIHSLLKYYCTSFTGSSTIDNKRVTRVYYFSKYACRKKRPMSLRLRMEEAADVGDHTFQPYGTGKDKRAHVGRGTTPHGPLADGGSGVQD